MAKSLRIDNLTRGQVVELEFTRYLRTTYEPALFARMKTDPDNHDGRRAVFVQINPNGRAYEWEAYRYNGHWAFGSSAQRLRLERIIAGDDNG